MMMRYVITSYSIHYTKLYEPKAFQQKMTQQKAGRTSEAVMGQVQEVPDLRSK